MAKFQTQWKKWIEELKERVPLDRPVVVKRTKRKLVVISVSGGTGRAERQMGCAELVNGKFIIEVSALEPRASQLDTLLHEWAHCLAYPAQQRAKKAWTHDDKHFGAAFATTYRAFYNEPTP